VTLPNLPLGRAVDQVRVLKARYNGPDDSYRRRYENGYQTSRQESQKDRQEDDA